MTKTSFFVVAPREDLALSAQAFVKSLPPRSIVLDDWLNRDAELTSHKSGPVCRVVHEVGIVQRFAGRGQVEETRGVEIGKYQDQKVDRQVKDGGRAALFRHDEYVADVDRL